MESMSQDILIFYKKESLIIIIVLSVFMKTVPYIFITFYINISFQLFLHNKD